MNEIIKLIYLNSEIISKDELINWNNIENLILNLSLINTEFSESLSYLLNVLKEKNEFEKEKIKNILINKSQDIESLISKLQLIEENNKIIIEENEEEENFFEFPIFTTNTLKIKNELIINYNINNSINIKEKNLPEIDRLIEENKQYLEIGLKWKKKYFDLSNEIKNLTINNEKDFKNLYEKINLIKIK